MTPANRAVVIDPVFQWRPVSGATTYQLEIARDHKFTEIVHRVQTPATRYVDTASWAAAGYWWRVKVVAPFRSEPSDARSFTRRWAAQTSSGRPNNVRVMDYSQDAGVQVPANAFEVRWDPVPGASSYQVQFDGEPTLTCTTPHTIFAPYARGGLGEDLPDSKCNPALGLGTHWVRVRAVDDSPTGARVVSLWSDEARADEDAVPAPVVFTMGPAMVGSDAVDAAIPVSPENGTVFQDVPSFAWQPVSWATQYELVIAYDQDFTNITAKYRTTNTRLIPLHRLPENTAVRSYYWYAVPCQADRCLNPNRAINREGRYGYFKKQNVPVKTWPANLQGTPWLGFRWEPYADTMTDFARRTANTTASLGGTRYYELQFVPRGRDWDTARSIFTDLTTVVPTDLAFGAHYKWRVRPVDESGSSRPWSDVRHALVPRSVPDRVLVRAERGPGRVTLHWAPPRRSPLPVTGYSVYYSLHGKRWKNLLNTKQHRASFTVRKKQRYWFMVTARNLAGESPPSRVRVGG